MTFWLNNKKGKLKSTLIKSYKINIDYILLSSEEKQTKIMIIEVNNKEIILLTHIVLNVYICYQIQQMQKKYVHIIYN